MNTLFKPLCLLAFVATIASAWGQGKTYCRFNVHYYERAARGKTEYLASYANYVDSPNSSMIPAGTEVVLGKYRRGFSIAKVEDKKVIHFEFHKQRMGMNLDAYKKLILSDKPVTFDKMAKVDQEGIKNGVAKVGMTKDGIKAALGYPAAHKTASLDADVWTYWRDRFRMMLVTFKDGKVVTAQ